MYLDVEWGIILSLVMSFVSCKVACLNSTFTIFRVLRKISLQLFLCLEDDHHIGRGYHMCGYHGDFFLFFSFLLVKIIAGTAQDRRDKKQETVL